MLHAICAGDVVRLITGGPEMTVERCQVGKDGTHSSPEVPASVATVWFDEESANFRKAEFSPCCLVVKEEKKDRKSEGEKLTAKAQRELDADTRRKMDEENPLKTEPEAAHKPDPMPHGKKKH